MALELSYVNVTFCFGIGVHLKALQLSMVLGVLYMVCGIWCVVWCMVYSVRYMVYGAMCMVYGVWCILILLRVAVKGTVRLKPGA